MSSRSQRRKSIDKLKSIIRSRTSRNLDQVGQFSSSSSSTVCTNGLCEETVTRTSRDKSGKLVTKKETRQYPMTVKTHSNRSSLNSSMISSIANYSQFPDIMTDFGFMNLNLGSEHKCNCPYCTL